MKLQVQPESQLCFLLGAREEPLDALHPCKSGLFASVVSPPSHRPVPQSWAHSQESRPLAKSLALSLILVQTFLDLALRAPPAGSPFVLDKPVCLSCCCPGSSGGLGALPGLAHLGEGCCLGPLAHQGSWM